MKKTTLVLLFVLAIAANAEVINKKTNNEFGGDSFVFIYNDKDKVFDQYYKKIEIYNKDKQLMKTEYYHTEKVVDKTGIINNLSSITKIKSRLNTNYSFLKNT